MSYKLPPIQRIQVSDSTTQVNTDTTISYPVLFDTNENIKGVTHDVAGATVTFADASGNLQCTYTGHTFVAGDCIKFSGGTPPTGIVAGTAYFVVSPGTNVFKLAAKPGGAAISYSDAGSGTITGKSTHRIYLPTTGDWLVAYSIICNGGLGEHVDLWVNVDGSPLARSNTICEFAKANAEQVVSCTFILTTTSINQKFELMWRGSNTNCNLLATGTQASPARPACPSAILTINKISK